MFLEHLEGKAVWAFEKIIHVFQHYNTDQIILQIFFFLSDKYL